MRTGLLTLTLVALSTGCDRGPVLAQRWGELVVVVPSAGEPLLETQAVLTLPDAVMQGGSAAKVTVRNVGDAPLVLSAIGPTGGSAALELPLGAPAELAPSAELALDASFHPPQDADPTLARVSHRASFRLEVEGARPGQPAVTVELAASAVARDCFVPAVFDFGRVPPGHRLAVPFEVSNTTPAQVTASLGDVLGADAAAFAVDGAASLPLAPGAAGAFTLAFAPTDARPYAAEVNVRRSETCPGGAMRLEGTGSDDAVTVAPQPLDFGDVPVGDTAVRSATFTNHSAAAVVLTSLSVSGAGFARVAPGDVVLPPRGSAAVALACTPAALGHQAGALTVDLPFTTPRTLRVDLACGGGGPRIEVTPRVLAFGAVPLLGGAPAWTVARRVAVRNVGTATPPATAALNLRLGLDGGMPWAAIVPLTPSTRAGEFSVQVPPNYDADAGIAAIPGEDTIDVDVRLTPQTFGEKKAELRLYSNDAVEPAVTLQLSATVVTATPCDLEVAPDHLQFGDVPPGTPVTKEIGVTNLGPATSTCIVAGAEVAPGSSAVFSAAPLDTTTLPGGQRLAVPVTLTFDGGAPQGTSAAGYLRFSTSDPTQKTVAVPLAGRVARCLLTTPSQVDFGTVRSGCRSEPRTLSVYNACSTPVELASLTPPAAPFALVQAPTLPANLAPGAAPLQLQVRFEPASHGPASDTLSLTSSEGPAGRQVLLPLQGVGDALGRQVDRFTVGFGSADVLFNIDDSCSMGNEQASLAANLGAFMTYAAGTDLDFHLAVITTDNVAPTAQGLMVRTPTNPAVLTSATPDAGALWAEKVQVGTTGSGWESAFATTLKALTPPLADNQNAGFLRATAALAVVVVSDAKDQSPEPVEYYRDRLIDVMGPGRGWMFTFNVIGPFGRGTSMPCDYDGLPEDVPGPPRYAPMVAATGGVQADICTEDWAAELERIGTSALGGRTVFPLSAPPDTAPSMVVRVAAQPTTAFSYDPVANSVTLTTAPPPGTSVEVEYTRPCF